MMRPHLFAATALVAAALAPAGPAFAQEDAAAVERCRALATDAERFACLEAYLLGDGASAEEPAAAPPAAPSPSADPMPPALAAPSVEAAEAAAVSAAAEASEGGRGLFRMPSIPFVGGGDDDAGSEPTVVDATGSAEAATLGEEQVAQRMGERPERISDTRYAFDVVEAEESFFGGLQVRLDNGQIWRQQRGDGTRVAILDSDPIQSVEIWQASRYGGYRMRLVGHSQERTLRVERVE